MIRPTRKRMKVKDTLSRCSSSCVFSARSGGWFVCWLSFLFSPPPPSLSSPFLCSDLALWSLADWVALCWARWVIALPSALWVAWRCLGIDLHIHLHIHGGDGGQGQEGKQTEQHIRSLHGGLEKHKRTRGKGRGEYHTPSTVLFVCKNNVVPCEQHCRGYVG